MSESMSKKLFLGALSSAAFMSTSIISTSVEAVTLDYRHEYKHHTEQHANRVKVSDSMGIFYYGLEAKFAGQSEDDGTQGAFSDLGRGDSEIDWGIKYPLDENWYIQPGMPITFGDGNNSLKPQFRIGYRASSLPLTTTLRYRRQYTSYSDDDREDYVQNKITFVMSYSPGDYRYWLELNYNYNEDRDIFDNGREAYDAIFGAGRRFGSWMPYFDLSDVGVSSDSDTRQLRTRVGLKYYY
tara:strand:- start:769 stop:1488 length:720 start_codon:yes stop_codon:yes gene_type:complete